MLTKITTMLLKASRYIIFLEFFQVSSITIVSNALNYSAMFTKMCTVDFTRNTCF